MDRNNYHPRRKLDTADRPTIISRRHARGRLLSNGRQDFMLSGVAPRNHSKPYKVARRPFESARLDAELKVPRRRIRLRNNREIWLISLVLSKIWHTARELLNFEAKDPSVYSKVRNALIRCLVPTGVLDEHRMRLEYALALKIEDFLERRLPAQAFKSGLAKSIHHARVLVRQRHTRVGKQIVSVPSFVVRLDSQKHIDFALWLRSQRSCTP
ncbi:unnamed protein product [Rhizoctonia solani]|uniref:RNA-binding S4 domain-containing protein n=1 Tax=Rhizoctonia solani TaxID=456999 RepID=A0A8H3E2G3_9AGAM|nr:unnamed protein product [Rhizoctonia solani]